MKVMENGGSINADFQCSVAHENGWVGNSVIAVMNSCKDFRPSWHWVCVCLPGLRYFHVDVRRFGIPSKVKTPKDLRKHMVSMLGAGGFADADALWEYAKTHDLPRILHPESCQRVGVRVTDDDLAVVAAVSANASKATCRALA